MNALNMRTLSLGAALVVSTAALAACGSSSSGGSAGAGGGKANPREGVERDAVTFGVINDLTGPVSAYAVPYVAGLKTYFDRVSKAGGVDGRTIKTIVTDDKLEVPPAITAFKKMQRQTPVLAASAFTSGATQTAVFDMVKSSGIAVLPQYTNKPAAVPRNPNFFLLQPSEADQVDQGLAYMKSKLKIDKPKVAVIGWNSSGGHELAELMSKRGKQGDVDYLGSTLVDPASTNLDAQINNVAKKHPDFIFLHCVETTTAVLLKSEQKFNLKIPVIGLAATGSASVYKSVKPETGQLFEYLLGFTPGNIDEAGTAQLVADAKTSGHADDADNPNFVQGYVTGQVMVEALKKAGPSPTRAGYIKALSSLQGFDTKGLSGPISFSATNNQGAALSRPTRYDYATGKLVAVGEYADFEDALTGEYSRGGS